MATTSQFIAYLTGQLADLGLISTRKMFGEYVLYHDGKIFGGAYDNRLMLKVTKAGRRLLPDAPEEPPYPGAKPMLVVEELDNPAFLQELVRAVCRELPPPRPRRNNRKSG